MWKKVVGVLALVSSSVFASVDQTPFGALPSGLAPQLDKLSSSAAARVIVNQKCEPHIGPEVVVQRMEQSLHVNIGPQWVPVSRLYVQDALERKLKALSRAHQNSTCESTHNLKRLAVEMGM